MKNKKLLIPAGICLLIRVWFIINFISFFESDSVVYTMYSIASRALEIISLLCVIGAFILDSKGKRRGAVVCAAICLVDALMRHFILGYVLFGESMTIIELLKSVAYIIPDVLLMVFVVGGKRSRNTWIIIGILLTMLTICDDYSLPLYHLYAYYSSSQIAMFSMVIKIITGIPHGLIYLFGFMNMSQVQKRTTYSYLEQYKREHGME